MGVSQAVVSPVEGSQAGAWLVVVSLAEALLRLYRVHRLKERRHRRR